MHQNKQTTHEKQNLSKTEQSVAICNSRILLELLKIIQKYEVLVNLSIDLHQKESTQKHISVNY